MEHLHLLKKIALILALFFFGFGIAWAKSQPSILDSSINWQDVVNKEKLLKKVPIWSHGVISELFDVYLHPEKAGLPYPVDINQYNILFIHAFWGPKENPFVRFLRPARAFLLFPDKKKASNFLMGRSDERHAPARFKLGEGSHRAQLASTVGYPKRRGPIKKVETFETMFYVAPIIRDESDGNYYVFDNKEIKPILLEQWANKMSKDQSQTIRFNICRGYGDNPTDTCEGRGYQYENIGFFSQKRPAPWQASSAKRKRGEDWRTRVPTHQANNTIYSESIQWNDIPKRTSLLSTVRKWSNYKIILDNFYKLRDLRYFSDPEVTHFPRRITWLYPDNGCWSRAVAVIKDLFGPFHNIINQFDRPSKVFVFGNLCAKTNNSPDGEVSWWYHTAPIVKDAETNQTYVLDPSVNPYIPLPLETWVTTITAIDGPCASSKSGVEKINICNGYGSIPEVPCENTYQHENLSGWDQEHYMIRERERQLDLKRNPDQVLGDLPPWILGVELTP